MQELVTVVTIEGIAVAAGQAKYCYPVVPDYAAADSRYNTGLRGHPSGVSSKWDLLNHKLSNGRFVLSFRPDVGPVPLAEMQPPAITALREDLTLVDTIISHALTNAEAGIAVNDMLYIDRETVKVTAATPSSTSFTAPRAQGGSAADRHFNGGNIFRVPPALTGRLVTVSEVPRFGSSEGAEATSVILRGYISGEPTGTVHWCTIQCVERFDQGLFNDDGVGVPCYVEWREGQMYGVLLSADEKPIGGATKGYWWLSSSETIWKADYSSAGWANWNLIWASREVSAPASAGTVYANETAYKLLLSDEGQGTQAPFGYTPNAGSFTASDNPIHIALNLLLSKDGTNKSGSETLYDRGAHEDPITGAQVAGGLYPRFSLGVPRAQVDVPTFERAAEELSGIHARVLWLGGTESPPAQEIFRRLLAPFGYAVGTRRDGVWTCLRLGDVYGLAGGPLAVPITNQYLCEAGTWEYPTLGRAVDHVIVEVDPGPNGEDGINQVKINEITSRRHYPRHVGAEERYPKAPYSIQDFTEDSPPKNWIATRLARLANRVGMLKIKLGPTLFKAYHVGDEVEVLDVAIRDPVTGARLTTGSTPLSGLVTDTHPDWRKRTCEISIALMGTVKMARYSPCAKLSGGSQITTTYTVEQHAFTRSSENQDALRFVNGDVVVLCNKNGVLRSSPVQGVTVSNSTNTTVVVSTRFRDHYGVLLTGNDDDIICYAGYDKATVAQLTDYAWMASGGAPASGRPDLGAANDPPYLWGD